MTLKQKIALNYMRARLRMMAAVSTRRAAESAFNVFCTPFDKSVLQPPPVFSKAERLSFVSGSRRVVGYRWNHPLPKKCLILHGFESCVRNFGHYVQPLLDKGYEVIAFDAPAHGESEGKQTNVLEYRNMIEDIHARFGPVHAFVGHSFGGLAAALALEKIDHTSDTRLVMIAPATETKTAIDSFFRLLHMNGEVRREFDRIIEEIGGHPVSWYSVTRALQFISAQILWIHDEGDTVTPLADVKPVIDAGHPNIRFYITKGWGHSRIYRENDVVNAVRDFL
jgi:pimeloyl-ACP methyl ester carboxylesterase